MRERRADPAELESNRLEIGRLNRELSLALIAQHSAHAGSKAA